MRIVAKVDFAPISEIIDKLGVGEYGRVQRFVDSEIIRQCEPYVPFDEGVLTASAWAATDIGSGLVVYNTPYAHYQYYGEVYGPNIPIIGEDGKIEGWFSPPGQKKSPTGRPLQYNLEKHPMAGSHWFERMLADHKDEILDGAREVAGAK